MQMVSEKLGKGMKAGPSMAFRKGGSGAETAELKETVARYKKKVKELEDYSDNLQSEMNKAQEKLVAEIEEKNNVNFFVLLSNNRF